MDASQEPDSSPEARDPAQMYGILMNVKSFIKFLSSSSVSNTTIACTSPPTHSVLSCCCSRRTHMSGICQNHAMILYVYIGEVADAGGVLTFYIPAIIDEP